MWHKASQDERMCMGVGMRSERWKKLFYNCYLMKLLLLLLLVLLLLFAWSLSDHQPPCQTGT